MKYIRLYCYHESLGEKQQRRKIIEQMHHVAITKKNGAETDADNLIIILPFL